MAVSPSYLTTLRNTHLSLRPDRAETALLIGALIPALEGESGLWLCTSTNTHFAFKDESAGPMLRLFQALPSPSEVVQAVTRLGGDAEDFPNMVELGMFRVIPGVFKPLEFLALFRDLGLVTLTASATLSVSPERVEMYDPRNPEKPIPVSHVLYEVIRRSYGERTLMQTMVDVVGADEECILHLTEELVKSLRTLMISGVVAVMQVDGDTAADVGKTGGKKRTV